MIFLQKLLHNRTGRHALIDHYRLAALVFVVHFHHQLKASNKSVMWCVYVRSIKLTCTDAEEVLPLFEADLIAQVIVGPVRRRTFPSDSSAVSL